VALARALVRPASLVLLDEPFSALDTPLRRRLRGELRQLQREIAATMVIVTHDPDEAALLGDEILILDQGRVLQTGKTEAVCYSSPCGSATSGCVSWPTQALIRSTGLAVWTSTRGQFRSGRFESLSNEGLRLKRSLEIF